MYVGAVSLIIKLMFPNNTANIIIIYFIIIQQIISITSDCVSLQKMIINIKQYFRKCVLKSHFKFGLLYLIVLSYLYVKMLFIIINQTSLLFGGQC